MATNDISTDAEPADIWRVLAEPTLYSDWVVGAKSVVDADPSWPAEGSKLTHRSGFGPIEIEDTTEVIAMDEAKAIELVARLGRLGTASVRIELSARTEGGTDIVMHEKFVSGPPSATQTVSDIALSGRNTETLRRLVDLAERGRAD